MAFLVLLLRKFSTNPIIYEILIFVTSHVLNLFCFSLTVQMLYVTSYTFVKGLSSTAFLHLA